MRIKFLISIIIFISFSILAKAQADVACTNWLYTPTNPSYAEVGQVNVTGNQITVEAVFNRTTPYSGGPLFAGDLVSKHNTPTDANYLLRPNSAEITTTNGYFITPGICEIELNKTYHAAMVYDGSTLKFYRDGYLMSQVAATGTLIQNSWKTRIGWYEPQGFNTNFIGYINEVRIWNVARTQPEIRTSMFNTLADPPSQTGLLAYYTFDNLINKQGNTAYNGVLGGSALINEANSNCDYTLDSCSASPVPCDNWLNNPANSSVSAGDLDISGNTVTVEALINRTQPYLPGGGNNSEGDVVSKHNTFTDVNYVLRPNHGYVTTTNGFFATPDICDLQLNKTYHVAMVYDGSTLKFYRDGLLMSQVAATGNLILNNWKTRIGWYEPQGVTSQFLGYVNEVRIWNVARTQAQLNAYKFTQLPNPTTQAGLKGYYTFDNLLNKQSDAAYNATINGSATINQTNTDCSLVIDSCSIILPVTLTSFTTQVKNNDHILIKWHTDEEYGIVKYSIQRSVSPNAGFATIGTVSAITNRPNNEYSFEDNTVKPNITYFYRLLIVEKNGASKHSAVRSERISTQSVYTYLYPNPTSGRLTLTIGNYIGNASLTVFNNLGQEIYSKRIMITNSTDIPVELTQQPKGGYWLQVVMNNQRIIKKIIKQ
jgi:hypothetical protein